MFSTIIALLVVVLMLIALVLGAIAIEDLIKSIKKDRDQHNHQHPTDAL